MRRRFFLAACFLLGSCAAPLTAPGPIGAAEGEWRQQAHSIPITNADGSGTFLVGRICRPKGNVPGRLVVIAHGAPPLAEARPRTQLQRCDDEAPRWFLERGFVVVQALRRGFGATGGTFYEASAPCTVDAYERSAHESARDLKAVIDYATALPYVRPDGAVMVGQSAGGWATVGLDSEPHPKVIALVSMAGGRGGHDHNTPGRNCQPENLVTAAGVLGRSALTPMLWIYTENDSFFAPRISTAMYQAFSAAGGRAELDLLGPFDGDGHRLFFSAGGSAIWGPLMERYLRERGAF